MAIARLDEDETVAIYIRFQRSFSGQAVRPSTVLDAYAISSRNALPIRCHFNIEGRLCPQRIKPGVVK
jgi:hypothetical protein